MGLGAVGARHVVLVVQRGLIVGHHLLREVLVRDLVWGSGFNIYFYIYIHIYIYI